MTASIDSETVFLDFFVLFCLFIRLDCLRDTATTRPHLQKTLKRVKNGYA